MSKKSNKHYKLFPLDSVEEGLQALGSLVSNVIINIKKYAEYLAELENLFDKYVSLQEKSKQEIYISAKEYDDISDKLLYRQREILKFTTDYQNSSFSYINLREYLVRQKYVNRPLDLKTKKILSEFLDIRNWTFHNPQSLLVAAKESAAKRLPNELVDLVKIEPQLNPVMIDNITHYDLEMLMTLKLHSNIRIEQFEVILENMKKDYSEMYDKIAHKRFHFSNGQFTKDVIYQEIPRISRFYHQANDMAQISMAIQKSKYDGSDKVFEEWVIKKSD